MHNNSLIDKRKDKKQSHVKRKVLFVVVTCLRKEGNAGNIQDFPYSVLSIIKYNEKFAEFSVTDLLVSPNSLDDALIMLRSKMDEFMPEIVGISIMYDNAYFSIEKISEAIKKQNKDIFVVLGGQAVSPIAKKVLINQPNVDSICYSEGEVPIRELLLAEDLNKLADQHPSWITRSKIQAQIDPQKTLLDDITQVIDLDYDYVKTSEYVSCVSFNPIDARYVEDLHAFPLVTSRGCPFKCTFCWHSGEDDRTMRYANVDIMIEHKKNSKIIIAQIASSFTMTCCF